MFRVISCSCFFDRYELHIQDVEEYFTGIFIISRSPSSQNLIKLKFPKIPKRQTEFIMFKLPDGMFAYLQITNFIVRNSYFKHSKFPVFKKHEIPTSDIYISVFKTSTFQMWDLKKN